MVIKLSLPFFEDARAFSEGRATVKLSGKWGYVDASGTSVIPTKFVCDYAVAGPFRSGLARVPENGKWEYIGRLGEFVIPARFDMALEFSEGLGLVRLADKYGYIDASGKIVVPPSYLREPGPSQRDWLQFNTGTGEAHRSVAEACEVGFINSLGAFAIPPQFLATGRFQSGLCLAETEKTIGYINQSGAFIWQSKWLEIGSFDPLRLLPPENAPTS